MAEQQVELIKVDPDLQQMQWDDIPTSSLRPIAAQALEIVKGTHAGLKSRFENLDGSLPAQRLAEKHRLTDNLVSWFVRRWNSKRTDSYRAKDPAVQARRKMHWCSVCGQREYCLSCVTEARSPGISADHRWTPP